MADIRIKDLATTATTTASDDFMAVDGAINGTRKMNAAAPAFLTSVTTPSLTSPAATNLTLAGGAGNSSIILTPAGTGKVGILTVTPAAVLEIGGASANTDFRISRTVSPSTFFSINAPGGSPSTATFGVSGTDILSLNSTSVTIANSTAGSAGAGALVVTGGLSAGGASYFGGAVTVNGAGRFVNAFNNTAGGYSTGFSAGGNDGGATTRGVSLAFIDGSAYHNWASYSGYLTLGTGTTEFGIMSTTTNGLAPDADGTMLFKIQRATGAATFAGAVTIGNTVNTVSPTSPNRTITMVVNGVTLYIAAKTTND